MLCTENQISRVLSESFDEESIREGVSQILGTPWEVELDRFRRVGTQEIAQLRAI